MNERKPVPTIIPVVIDVEHADDCPANPKNQGKSKGGPAKVNSDAFRDGWTNIFGQKRAGGDA